MNRLFHHYLTWEDYKAGMWRSVSGRAKHDFLLRAIEFTGNAKLYGSFMLKVLDAWPIACEHNLTDSSQNRKAWIGHAATCLALGCPEDITRQAWSELTRLQQDAANAEAQLAIELWEMKHAEKNQGIYIQMELAGLQKWYPRRGGFETRVIEQSAILSEDMHGNT